MSSLKECIMENVVKPHTNMNFGTIIAEVYELDNVTNRAKIIFKDPKGLGFINLENVPIQLGSGGVHSAGPLIGDRVWVTFLNNSPLCPKIISLADESYEVNTREKTKHTRKGAFIPDSICSREEYNDIAVLDKLTLDSWFDEDNEDYSKYVSYEGIDAINTLTSATSTAAYYNAEEPGITHPLNSSTIKVRNNGMIDVFVATNQGIRIDPVTKSINFIGNSEKHHISNLSMFIDEKIDITAKNNISIATDKAMTISTLGEWTINSKANINIKSEGNITVSSSKDTILVGNRIIFRGDTFTERNYVIEPFGGIK